MKFSTKRWFTIWEILVIVIVISVGLLSVVVVLTNGMKYVQKTRQKVIALNLAREWMEAVYQIRDTNRTRRAGVKDTCRLKINPLTDDWWTQTCTDDLRFTSWSYALQRLTTWWQWYFALTWPFLSWITLDDGIDSGDLQFSLCQESGYWDSCIWVLPLTSEGKYFRQIEWRWLYLKNVPITWWTEISCTWGMSSGCWTSRAKEFRFCSKVMYVGDSTGEVEFCGVITNFKGK
jgi:type II secretory pathway pseudopilin PulG